MRKIFVICSIIFISYLCGCCASKSARRDVASEAKIELDTLSYPSEPSTVTPSPEKEMKEEILTGSVDPDWKIKAEAKKAKKAKSQHKAKPQSLISNTPNIIKVTPSIESITGRLNYVIDDTMEVNKNYMIEVTISKNVPLETIIKSTKTFVGNNIKDSIIRITSKMQARLIDPTQSNFHITAITDTVQIIEDNQITTWRWNVTPLKDGKNNLSIVVDIIIEDTHKSMTVYDGEINVFMKHKYWVRIGDFFVNNWQWIAGSLILPFLIWLFNTYILKKKRKK